jgi:hypothetical protein
MTRQRRRYLVAVTFAGYRANPPIESHLEASIRMHDGKGFGENLSLHLPRNVAIRAYASFTHAMQQAGLLDTSTEQVEHSPNDPPPLSQRYSEEEWIIDAHSRDITKS